MSSTTNTAINSRSMNGIITISDGIATLENGDLDCDDINSNRITAGDITSNIFVCKGEFRSNTIGPYTIPVSISSSTGSLISYGNTSGNGATDFTNYGSTYNTIKQGFNFWNINSTQTLTNLAIIDNSQTYFKSQLVGCTAETPLNTTSVVNKTYVDSNFVDRVNNLTQNINGLKTFTNNTTFNAQATFDSFTPICSVANPTAVNHLTRKDYVDNNFLDRTNNLTQNINGLKTFTNNTTFNAQATFDSFTPICSVANPTAVNHLTRKDYVDNNFLDRTNNLTQNINGLKTFANNCDFSAILSLKNKKELNQTQNIQTDTNYTLGFPFPETTVIRTITVPVNTITIILPAVSATERGLLFNFFKFKNGLNVIFQSTSLIFTLNNLSNGSTTNTTLLSSDKIMTTLMCGSFGTTYYWVEVNTYSTFDRDQNNLIYARLASPNEFTNTNTFNSFLPTSTQTPSLNTQLITKIYADTNFLDRTNNLTQNVNGLKTFTNNTFFTPTGSPTSPMFEISTLGAIIRYSLRLNDGNGSFFSELYNNGIVCHINNKNTSGTINFTTKDGGGNPSNPIIISSASTTIYSNLVSNAQATFDNFTPICSVSSPTANNHLTRKDYVDNNFVDKITDQTITGTKRFLSIFSREYSWNDAQTPFTGRIQAYLSGTNLGFISVNVNNNSYTFYTKDVTGTIQTSPLTIDSGTTTIANNLASNAITYVKEIRWRDQVAGTEQQSYLSGTIFDFVALFNSNTYRFFCRDSGSAQTTPLTINSANTTIANNLVSNNITAPSSTIAGENNIYTNLIASGTIKIGNLLSTNVVEGDTTFSSDITTPNIFCNDALYLNDYQPLPSPITYSSILVQNSDILNFDANFNNNKFQFKVSSNAVLLLDATNTTIYNNLISNSQATFNNLVNLKNTTRIYDLITPFTNYTSLSTSGNAFAIYPNYPGSSVQFYCRTSGNLEVQTFYSFATGNTSVVPFTASSTATFNGQATFNAGAIFNTVLPTTTITATSANQLVNYTTLTNQGFITSSSILSANNSFTGFNTFTYGLTIRDTLYLKNFTNTQQGSIDLSSAILSISCDVNSGKVQINTHDSGGNSYNRVIINETEFNLTVPITLFLDYTYYNPVNFTSTRLGYSMSNTGSTNTLTNNVANNSGQINIPAGSWNITYTGTITVITNAITTLTSLEIYVADNLTNDLNIIGINVINYYKISTVPVGQKMRISGSGNYISYTNSSTELNLRLLPLFTAGTGGLNFQGKISATRNA